MPSISRAEFDQDLGSAAVEFGVVQIACDFKHHRNLRRQSAGAANILAGDAGIVKSIKHAEHAQHTSIGTQQRNGKQLPRLDSG